MRIAESKLGKKKSNGGTERVKNAIRERRTCRYLYRSGLYLVDDDSNIDVRVGDVREHKKRPKKPAPSSGTLPETSQRGKILLEIAPDPKESSDGKRH